MTYWGLSYQEVKAGLTSQKSITIIHSIVGQVSWLFYMTEHYIIIEKIACDFYVLSLRDNFHILLGDKGEKQSEMYTK